MFFQIKPLQEVIAQNAALQKQFSYLYSQAINFQNNDFCALLFAILYKLPITHKLCKELQQQKEELTTLQKTKNQIYAFKKYLQQRSVSVNIDIYQGGGQIFQMLLKDKYKIKVSRITEEILKTLSSITDFNFQIYQSEKIYQSQVLKPIGRIILFKIKDYWYMPIQGQKETEFLEQQRPTINNLIQQNQPSCLLCNIEVKNLKKSPCNHDYCVNCLEKYFSSKSFMLCKKLGCNSQINRTDVFQENCKFCKKTQNLFKSQCGHPYCNQCIEYLKNQNKSNCKECGKDLQFSNQIKQDYEVEVESQLKKKQEEQNKLNQQLFINNEQSACRYCSQLFEDKKDLFYNKCGHQYCEKCIVRLEITIRNDCVQCLYSILDAKKYFQKRKESKYLNLTNYIVLREKQTCNVCNSSSIEEKNLFTNMFCGHRICLKCIEQKELVIQKCYVTYCRSRIDSTLVYEFYQDHISQLASLDIPLEERNCLNCNQINKTQSKIDYFKCQFCFIMTCVHQKLLKECQCMCENCFGNLTPLDNNIINCQKCKIKLCVLCKESVEYNNKNHICKGKSQINGKLSNDQSKEEKYSLNKNGNEESKVKDEKQGQNKQPMSKILEDKKKNYLEDNKLREEQKQSQIRNDSSIQQNGQRSRIYDQQKECGGCLQEFDDYIVAFQVEKCSIHKQCINCKFSNSQCILCNRYEKLRRDSDEDRVLLIQEVPQSMKYQLYEPKPFRYLEDPKTQFPVRNSSLNPTQSFPSTKISSNSRVDQRYNLGSSNYQYLQSSTTYPNHPSSVSRTTPLSSQQSRFQQYPINSRFHFQNNPGPIYAYKY